MTAQFSLKLPIRIVPHISHNIYNLFFFGFVFCFASFITSAGFLDDNKPSSLLNTDQAMWLIIGTPFILTGFGGIIVTILKMLPRSPYVYLEISHEGVLIRSFFSHCRYIWKELPAFEVITIERSTKKGGTKISYYVIALEKGKTKKQREIVRIDAGQYGSKNALEDAEVMVDWFNDLRERAQNGHLSVNETIDIPQNFQKTSAHITTIKSAPFAQQQISQQSAPTIERRER